MRNKAALFAVVCLAGLMSSCLGGSTYDTEIPRNCQISSFVLSHDSISGLDSVKFTIDQLNGRIFNLDSLPYGTEVGKVICTVEYMNTYSVASVQLMPEATGDTIVWNAEDSVDFSKPVQMVVKGLDGVIFKSYTAQVNIHQVVPDSMVWSLHTERVTGQAVKEQTVVIRTYEGNECYFMYVKPDAANASYRLYYSAVGDAGNWAELKPGGLPASGLRLKQMASFGDALYLPSEDGALYCSVNGLTWTAVEQTPPVHYILGGIKGGVKQTPVLAAITGRPGSVLRFASMNSEGIWTTGEEVPAGFPLTGFGRGNYVSMYYEYLMTVCGRDKDGQLLNSAWATQDGLAWVMLTGEEQDYFSKREGVMVTAYDDKIWMIGGIDGEGKASKEIYQSLDKGISWTPVDTSMIVLPEDYTARGFSSVHVDDRQFLLIFGGKSVTAGNERDEIWRGRINRLGFGK